MKINKGGMELNKSFQDWWNRINILINRALVLLFAGLIASQVLLMNQTLKTFISRTDRLEGKSIADSQLFIRKGEIEITIENLSSMSPLVFYVNGESAGTSAGNSVWLQVKDNDVIEASGANYHDTVILKVTSVSDNITVPEPGKLIYVNNNLVLIDRVRLK
ncbi:MAG: hypothetical protein APF77_22830 [Clostridia bacterium BRH_c25]|nr:MAG: hypothetical protein APF77_22830 [Clostridia bacterium BRH_c25]